MDFGVADPYPIILDRLNMIDPQAFPLSCFPCQSSIVRTAAGQFFKFSAEHEC